jgi:hypothetical protein
MTLILNTMGPFVVSQMYTFIEGVARATIITSRSVSLPMTITVCPSVESVKAVYTIVVSASESV